LAAPTTLVLMPRTWRPPCWTGLELR